MDIDVGLVTSKSISKAALEGHLQDLLPMWTVTSRAGSFLSGSDIGKNNAH